MLRLIEWILRPWEANVEEATVFQEPRDELIEKLRSEDPDDAHELLEEARRLNETVDALSENVERRATTLQGVVSIAATFSVAAGALLLDPGKIEGKGWRLVLVALFGAVVYCLIATAFRATQASTQIHWWSRADPADNFKRPDLSRSDFELEQAVDMLRSYGRNTKVVAWKVTYMGAASKWFLRGLIFLGLIAVVLGSYAFLRSDHEDPTATQIEARSHRLGPVQQKPWIPSVRGRLPQARDGTDAGK
jgi:hypothetical protein